MNFYLRFLTLKASGSHMVATRETSVGSVEAPLTVQRGVGDVLVNSVKSLSQLDMNFTTLMMLMFTAILAIGLVSKVLSVMSGGDVINMVNSDRLLDSSEELWCIMR